MSDWTNLDCHYKEASYIFNKCLQITTKYTYIMLMILQYMHFQVSKYLVNSMKKYTNMKLL